ncbi:MAG TPA: ABC transporter permease [Gammaproteobacteria bacterium]|nr:ABC transporter permease [Gammaproteobacteria bacterium]
MADKPVAAHRGRRRLELCAGLAFDDYRHEWVISGCSVLALAAVLIPLLVLFGLKYGIITNLLDPLIENPRYREVAPIGSGSYEPDWFEQMRAREDVAFVVPRTRSLAASIRLRAPDSEFGRIIDIELIPSAQGDPVLDISTGTPSGFSAVVISMSAAEKLSVDVGDALEGVVVRTRNDRQESERLPMTVAGIAPITAFTRDGLFVSTQLIAAVEDFLDGRAVPSLGWEGTQARPDDRSFASFRLYAGTIDDVAGLRQAFSDQGIEVRTSVADIELVERLDRNLSAVYWIIALIAVSGYCISFATNVWANVDRKRREFSVLRLTGFRTREIVWFPLLQAEFTAIFGWIVAVAVFLAVQGTLNVLLAATIGGGQPVCRLEVWHMLIALVMTMFAALIAAIVGGRQVARLEPSIGLRE